MDKNSNNISEVTAPDSIPGGSAGVMVLFFPDDVPSVDVKWQHPNGQPAMDDIPLYRPGESKPFSSLQFVLKRYEKKGDLLDTVASISGQFYAVESSDGLALAPYEFEQGDKAAQNALFNHALFITKNMWEKTHYHSMPLYRVSFRLKGGWGDWLYIILNDATKEGAYVKCDSLRMQLLTWEHYLTREPVLHLDGHELYNKPNGSPIKIKDYISSPQVIAPAEGDWVQVEYNHNNYGRAKKAWLRWRNDDGMLPGIYAFEPVY